MHLVVSSRVVDSKVLRMAIQFEYLSLVKRKIGKCNVRNFRWFHFGMCPDVPAFKVRDSTSDI